MKKALDTVGYALGYVLVMVAAVCVVVILAAWAIRLAAQIVGML